MRFVLVPLLKMKSITIVAFFSAFQQCFGSPLNLDYLKKINHRQLVNDIEDKFEVHWYRLVNNGWCLKKGCTKNNYERIMEEIKKNDFDLQDKSTEVRNAIGGIFNDETSNAMVEFNNLGLTKEQGLKLMDHYGVFIVSDLTCGGTNKACEPETLKTIEEYSKTLEASYGFNGRNVELTDDERVKNYIQIRLIVKKGFSEVDSGLKLLKHSFNQTDFEFISAERLAAYMSYFISSFSDLGDASDDVLKANGSLNTDLKQATYDDMKNDIATNFVELCNGLNFDGLGCKDFHWIE